MRIVRLALLAFTPIAFLAAGCAHDSGVLPPRNDVGSGGAAIPCWDENRVPNGTSVDKALSDGSWPVLVASIESVKPVLDSFYQSGAKDAYSDRACTRLEDAEPALRVALRVEQASWGVAEGESLTLVLDAGAFQGFKVEPILQKNGSLAWSDGNSYLKKGGRLLIIGGLLETGELYASGRFLLEVDAENLVQGYREAQCVGGTLNGRDVSDVVKQASEAWNGERPMMRGELPPLATLCFD